MVSWFRRKKPDAPASLPETQTQAPLETPISDPLPPPAAVETPAPEELPPATAGKPGWRERLRGS
ncbi:MAG TPA: hypothetical protein VIT22_14075, partial [Pseudoxanthomonas sp.]